MTQAATRPTLTGVLLSLCEDALFGVLAEGALDPDNLRALAKRRSPSRMSGAGPTLLTWEPWVVAMTHASATIAPPRFLPMASAIEEGLTLEGGARGVRALFTKKPSEKDTARVRGVGGFAVRVLGAVHLATGVFDESARLERAMFVASLGLSEADQLGLLSQTPTLAEAIDYTGPIDSRMAKHIIKGAFYSALVDGLDPREEGAIDTIAKKLFLQPDDINTLRNEARAEVDGQRALGAAGVDAIRYVVSDVPVIRDAFANVVALLGLPAIYRTEVVTALQVGGQVNLGNKHRVDRKEREAALGLAWLAALATDPTYTRRTELALRHDLVAADLGGVDAGPLTRAVVEQYVEAEILPIARA